MDPAVAPTRARRLPWLIGVASIPYGSFNGLIAVALPYLLSRHGISIERIATIGATVQVPAIWYFLWAPVVDVKFRRRTWVMALSAASGVLAALAVSRDMAASIGTVTGLLIAASVFSQPVSSAIGGLVAGVVPDSLRGRTGGLSQAGILGGGVLAGGAAVWLSGHGSRAVLGLTALVFIAGPAFAVLAVHEPRRTRASLRAHLAGMGHELLAMLKRRDVWLGFVFFLSPIGASALMNLLSAVAGDFRASSSLVIWAVVEAGVMTPAGAIVGGIICDRFDRWRVYPMAGLFQAAVAAGIMAAPLTPVTYLVAAAAYAFATGVCYATFMALAFHLLGAGAKASGTQFTLFMAAVNLPVAYMLRLDGWGHAHAGVRGMLAVDAAASAFFGLLFLALLWRNERARQIISV